jgi:hypothetical protein
VLDKRQLGYKVTANSLYGQCGAKTSSFYDKDCAASTTATGRLLLTYAKKIIETCYNGRICETETQGPVLTKAEYIYGDSVTHYTPIYVKEDNRRRMERSGNQSYFLETQSKENTGKILICTIAELASIYGDNKWILCTEEGKQDKEFCELDGILTWSEKGWTPLHRVIRHILAPHKKIIRVLTHTGLVDVTDDHSLLTKEGNEISPKDLKVGDSLLHHELPKPNEGNTITEEEAMIMGFFFGDGSCGVYDTKCGLKATWALNNASTDIIDKYIDLCKNVYKDLDWVVMPTLESSGVYKISPRSKKYGSISNFVRMYRKKLYFNNEKIIPLEIISGNLNIKKAFWEGMYDADGDKNGFRIDQKNQISAAYIYWLAESMGFKASINTRKDKLDIFRITLTEGKQRKNIH